MIADDDIISPQLYADENQLHTMLTELRQTTPIRWTEPRGYRPFWTITKHVDIKEIECNSDQFLAAPRTSLVPIEEEERRQMTSVGMPRMRVLPNMDDPDHRRYRDVTRAWFQPVALARLEAEIGRLAQIYIDELRSSDGALDFATQIAARFPLRVIMLMLGTPARDQEKLQRLVGQIFSPYDPDRRRSEGMDPIGRATAELFTYFGELLDERLAHPREDLLSVIATAQIEDGPMGRFEANCYCLTLLAAAYDGTAGAIAGGLHALITNPDQYQRLRADQTLIRSAIEEILRYTSPIRSFFRTAAQDYELRGTRIRAGQSLLLLYPSANRDEDVFERPQEFDIHRTPNPHVAFGHGPHICLGLQLARLELKHLFSDFIAHVEAAEFDGPTTWIQANFSGGPKFMPIRCRFDLSPP